MAASASPTLYLPQILERTRAAVAERKATADLRALEAAAVAHTPRGFARALRARAAAGEIAIIAELKKASPSRGLIRADFDAAALALQLEAAGAAALSVLTDEPHFSGSLANLERASQAVALPCLRKDFMVDSFQMLEARAHRADAVLLIVAALTDAELHELRASARAHELDVLCEVHTLEEAARAAALDCECVGVNSRDLRTFDVSLDRAASIAASLPAEAVKIAESGLHTADDLHRMQAAGFDAALIGESLMRAPHPGHALQTLRDALRNLPSENH